MKRKACRAGRGCMQGHFNNNSQITHHSSLPGENRRYPRLHECIISNGRYCAEISISCLICQCKNPLFPSPPLHSFKLFSRHPMARCKIAYIVSQGAVPEISRSRTTCLLWSSHLSLLSSPPASKTQVAQLFHESGCYYWLNHTAPITRFNCTHPWPTIASYFMLYHRLGRFQAYELQFTYLLMLNIRSIFLIPTRCGCHELALSFKKLIKPHK